MGVYVSETDRQTEAERHTEIVFDRERESGEGERARESMCVDVT